MIIQLHTPKGIINHELTPIELKKHAASGHLQARKEIYNAEIDLIPELNLKIQLLSWAIGFTDYKPSSHKP